MAFPRALDCSLAMLLGVAPLSACAESCAPVVEGGWIRNPPAALPMLAGYARISNPCKGEVVVVGASSPAFAEATLHATTVENGISRMRETRALRVPPGKLVALEPGGMHLMLMHPTHRLRQGEQVVITFQLADGRTLDARFDVKGPKAVK